MVIDFDSGSFPILNNDATYICEYMYKCLCTDVHTSMKLISRSETFELKDLISSKRTIKVSKGCLGHPTNNTQYYMALLTFHFQFHCYLFLVRMISEEACEPSFIWEPYFPDPEGHLPLTNSFFQQLRPAPVFRCLLSILILAISVEMNHPREGRPVPSHLHACSIPSR